MTERDYYDHVNDIVELLDKIYDKVGGLRDVADLNEKQIYNDTRGILSPLADEWRRFRDNLPPERAEMLL